MGDIFAALVSFLLSNVDRRSSARSWPLMLLAVLGSAGALLWRYPDPAEMIARRIPSLVFLGLGALFAAWGTFLFIRQRPRILPADRIVIGIARLNPVGGARADAFGGETVEDLYHVLRQARAEGAPIEVRRVYALIPESETDEARMEAARRLARQPNVRVHLLVWGDIVVGRRYRLFLHTTAGEQVAPVELRDMWSRDYSELAQEFPDLSYGDYLLYRCGEAYASTDALSREFACYRPVTSLLAAAARGHLQMRLADNAVSHETSARHLCQARSDFDRLIGIRPDLAGLRSWGSLRGRME